MSSNNTLPFALEVCVDSLAAIDLLGSHATRIEISQQLELGGITPTNEFVRDACRRAIVDVVVLIRCRGGGFQYTKTELDRMLDSVRAMQQFGVSGVVVGALRSKGELDWDFMESVVALFPGGEKVVHRAFDLACNPIEQLKRLKEIGFKRVLTSGGPATAIEGIDQLRNWNDCRLVEILPAGGIRASNAEQIVKATECNQLHGSFQNGLAGSGLPDISDIVKTRRILERLSADLQNQC